MKKVAAIRYVDAFYTDEVTGLLGRSVPLPAHIAVGSVSFSNNEIVMSYASEEGESLKGLRIPLGALILDDLEQKTPLPVFEKGQIVGVYWKDIVYFENKNVPTECSSLYTEGKVFHLATNAIVIEDPETVRTVLGRVGNHPEKKPKYYVIPFSFIVNIERHGK